LPDIRDKVEEDRGLLKRIQMHIPGYAGYRRREDLRAADKLLRIQIADRLTAIRKDVENTRGFMTRNYTRDNIEQLGNLILSFQEVEGKLRYSAGGYSGLSADIRIEEGELEKLYEYDYTMVTALDAIAQAVPPMDAAVKAKDKNVAAAGIDTVQNNLNSLHTAFKQRLVIITGTEAVR
jgi:hypothetical protein